jgi:hypothetical protein|tara:strand:- start:249 stop:449 length:201 start_codon:yes stop_codon:yes gene_type:complete
MNIIDKILLKFFGWIDTLNEKVVDVLTFQFPNCQEKECPKKKKSKRTYKKEKDHGTDITFENEIKK